jgi:glycosyltransferase involved in cell wall biosynthesis
MRVAFIHPFLYRYPRGIERYTINLGNALAGLGVDVSILTWRWPQPVRIDMPHPTVRVHLMPTSRYYNARVVPPFYIWHLARQRYDFLWLFFAGYGEAEALTVLRRQRFGVVFHFPYVQVPQRYHEFQRYGLIRRAERIVSVSQFVADGVLELYRRDSTVIHHGVDPCRFAPDAAACAATRRMLHVAPEAPLLVTAAALEQRKGVQRVLRALPGIRRELPNVQYVVLGEGEYRGTLEQLVRELDLTDCVRFLGAQSDVTPFYQAADLSLILSHGEASSLVALESLACGLPVVAAKCRPFDELLDGSDGICVNDEDEQAVVREIASLLRDLARRRDMGTCGRARILADFRWEHVAEQYLHVISQANPGATTATSRE